MNIEDKAHANIPALNEALRLSEESNAIAVKQRDELIDKLENKEQQIYQLKTEVERLTEENATLTDIARQNCCKFVRQQEENATLKKEYHHYMRIPKEADQQIKKLTDKLHTAHDEWQALEILSDGEKEEIFRLKKALGLAEVVHAHWIDHHDGSYTCTNCHRRMSKSAYGYPRCPNCGAVMDEKDDSND